MGQPKKQSDAHGAHDQNVKGKTNVQPLRPNDQNVKHANQPQHPEAKHPQQKPASEN